MKRLLSAKLRLMWLVLAFLIVLLPIFVLLVEHSQSVFGSRSQPTSPTQGNSSTPTSVSTATLAPKTPTSTPTATLPPDFSAFVGEWYGHGRGLTFSSDGQAKYTARAYQWCDDPGVSPPCDSWQGNNIIDGINEDMRFTYVAGNTAYGTITASSDGTTGHAVSLILDANDTATLKTVTSNKIPLCGENTPITECGV